MKEKGIDIDKTEIDLVAGSNLKDDFKAKNPFGRVPVLELDDGTCIAESQAINHYLELIHPQPNLFGDSPEEVARIEMWSRRVDLNLLMPCAQAFRNKTGFFKDREVCLEEWGRISSDIFRDAAALFDDHLGNNRYLMGERYCVADMTLAIVLGFAKRVGEDVMDMENLARFSGEVTARPAFSPGT